jgi:trehalose-6-phosphate synthase
MPCAAEEREMRRSLRFIVPLCIALAAIAWAFVSLADRLTWKWSLRDLETRSAVIAHSVQENLFDLARKPNAQKEVLHLFEGILQDERVYAVGFCDDSGGLRFATDWFPRATVHCPDALDRARSDVVEVASGPLHVTWSPVEVEGHRYGYLVIAHDMAFARLRSADTRRYLFFMFATIAAVVALITVVTAEISWRGWVAGIKALISGRALMLSPEGRRPPPELRPIAKDLRALVRELEAERHPRDESQMGWGPDGLRRVLREDLRGDEVLIVSNREPYLHVRRDGRVEIQRPASGLVSALEPVMRACSGTWIAHGSGSADREVVDSHDRVAVPPGRPSYRIRRVWLSQAEEDGYYYGFANRGLWPLCHVAHTRPVFRASDWEHYRRVNERFADAVRDEARTDDPIVLVQDYHFALLPRLVRERLPRATLITFWHVPWPNPEAFGILPWGEEVLEGLLGSSILGFHTQFHCNNFFETVDRYVEARVDRETFNITHGGEQTEVRRYPISIAWPPEALVAQPSIDACRREVREALGVPPDRKLGIGVDRMDYTKGILERFTAVERLLEMEPRWIGVFSFVQIAAPSRVSIEEYRDFGARVKELADSINARFGRPGYQPIILDVEHRDAVDVYRHYRAADLCVVSSLHDGMNLVAKEFVAARDDERGVLLLSRFAGAARELSEALIVNPYDTEQCAAAMHVALTMAPDEQRARMRSMRQLVQEFDVYRWAGRMLIDAARMRHRERIRVRTHRIRLRALGT